MLNNFTTIIRHRFIYIITNHNDSKQEEKEFSSYSNNEASINHTFIILSSQYS